MNQEKNILLICMSTGQNDETYFYKYGESYNYSGECQLEPGTKHIMQELGKQGRKLDKIFILATPEAKKNNVEYYKDKIAKFINQKTSEFKIMVPDVKEGETESERKQREAKEEKKMFAESFSDTKFCAPHLYHKYQKEQYEKLYEIVDIPSPNEGIATQEAYEWMPKFVEKIQELKKAGTIKLFLDMQGGARTSSFILNAVIDMIQEEGVVLEKAYATAFDRKNEVNSIKDETYALRVFELVSGMDEFISYGKANKFKSYLDFYKKSKGSITAEEDKIVESIQIISDAISVCDIESFYNEVKILKQTMEEYMPSKDSEKKEDMKSENSSEKEERNDGKDPIFLSVVQKLKEAYQDITYFGSNETTLDSIEVMKWCLDRELYQQALTICESKMPKQMVDDGLITLVNRNELEKIRGKESKKYQSDNVETYVIKNYHYWISGKKRPESLFSVLEEESHLVKSDYVDDIKFREIIREYFKICGLRHQINHGNSTKQGQTVKADVLEEELNNFIRKYRQLKSKENRNVQKMKQTEYKNTKNKKSDNMCENNERRSDITKYVLRYVVPFGFDKNGSIDSYKNIVDKIKKDSKWEVEEREEYKQGNIIREIENEDGEIETLKYGGSDIYDYLKKLYHFQKSTAIGSAWEYKKESLPKFKYYRYNKKENRSVLKFNVVVTDVGLYLFKTGVGMFWYEVNLEGTDEQIYLPNSNELKIFQNRFKELAKADKELLRYDIEDKKSLEDIEKKKNDKECYIGEWVDDILKNEVSASVYYYPERTIEKETRKIPDKAILYNYIVTTNAKYLDKISYYLTMGYKNSYRYNKKMLQTTIARPFENQRWYAAKEGCGCYVARRYFYRDEEYRKSDDFIYHDYIPIRMKSDYFLMFIHLLQQSYSILHMSTQIAENVSAEENGTSEVLRDMEEKVNRFLIKSVNASVSHIGHHNEFYSYVEKALRIKEDVSALNEGVEVLEEILRGREAASQEKRNERMQTAFALLTILGILGLPKTLGEFFLMKGYVDNAGDLPMQFLKQMSVSVGLKGIYWITIGVFGLVLLSSIGILLKWLGEFLLPASVLRRMKKQWQKFKNWMKDIRRRIRG